jgi:hypothetical protein
MAAEEQKKWKSDVYSHYKVLLERITTPTGDPKKLRFLFTCRFDPKEHQQRRDRMATSQGTTNLRRTNEQCCKRRKVAGTSGSAANAQQDLHNSISRYTPIQHRAIIALRCASSHCPFQIVADPYYKKEVELLRPGTVIPSPLTVSKDLQQIYQQGSLQVKKYFSVCVTVISVII